MIWGCISRLVAANLRFDAVVDAMYASGEADTPSDMLVEYKDKEWV